MKHLLIAGLVGAALAASTVSPAVAQTVPTDPNGFSPYDTRTTVDENVNTPVVRNAPALGLSSIYGLNPCSLGASAGVTTPLFGVAGAISTTDHDCEIRNTAALAITGLKDEAAGREILCMLKEFREAVARLGKPCIQDQKQAPVASAAAPQPQALPANATQQQPAPPIAATPVAAVVPVVPAIAPEAPAYCKTAGLVLSAYPECTHPILQTRRQPEKSTKIRSPAPAGRPPTVVRQAPQDTTRTTVADREYVSGAPAASQRATSAATTPRIAAPATEETAAMLASNTAVPTAGILHASLQRPAAANPSDLIADLLQRGGTKLASGDVAEARLLYERAAKAGSAIAASKVAKTYDPQFLASIHAIGAGADPMAAAAWYQRAKAMEDSEPAGSVAFAARD